MGWAPLVRASAMVIMSGTTPKPLAAATVIGQRNLDGGVDGFGARVEEKDVIEIARHQRRDLAGELEGGGMGKLEGRCIVELQHRFVDRLGDLLSAMTGRAAEEP